MKKYITLLIFSFLFICFYSSNNEVKAATDIDPNQTTVHVKTADEFIDAYLKPYDKSYNPNSDQSGNSNIQKIIVDNDINLNDSSYSRYNDHYTGGINWYWMSVNHNGSLTFDGQGHTVDFGRSNIAPNGSSMQGHNWEFKDIKILGTSFYGPLSLNDKNETVTYNNFTYYGSQLIHTTIDGDKVKIKGDCNINSVPYYKALGKKNYSGLNKDRTVSTDSSSQQNLEVRDVEIMPNATYTGTSYKDNIFELSGNLTVDDGATVNLHPHNWGNTEHTPPWTLYNNSSAIYFSSSSVVNINKNANLNIYNNSDSITINDGSKIDVPSNYKGNISSAIFAYGGSKMNVNDGARINIDSDGTVDTQGDSSDPLIQLNSADINIGKNSEFYINQKSDNNNAYTNDGLVYLKGGNFNISPNGSMNIDSYLKNSKNSNNSYLIDTDGSSVINFDNPKLVNFNTHSNLSKNYIMYSSNNNYINATDFAFSAKGEDAKGEDTSILENSKIPIHRLLYPISGNSVDNNYIRVLGSYEYTKEFYDSLNKMNSKQYREISFTRMPTPVLTLDHSNINDSDESINGNVKDDDGNNLKNAYIKIYVNKNNKDNYFSRNFGINNVFELINANQVLFNKKKKDFPTTSSYKSGDSFKNNTLHSSDFISENSNNQDIFENYISPFTDFNNSSELYEKSKPYYALTDDNGNFKFDIPQSLWELIGSDNLDMQVVATYNFVDSNKFKIKLNSPMQLNLSNSIKNLSNSDSNQGDHKLVDVNQGEEGIGDELEFSTDFTNFSKHIDYKFNYEQPIPLSIDESSIKVNDDGSYKSLKDSSYDYEVKKGNEYKTLILKKIQVNRKKDDNPTIKNIKIKGKLDNKNKKYSSDSIEFNPSVVTDGGNTMQGPDSSISFIDPDGLKISPNDIIFNGSHLFENGLYYASGSNLAVAVKDKRSNRPSLKLTLQQNTKKFTSDSNSSSSFEGELFYKKNNQYVSIFNNPVEIASSSSGQSLSNVYWKNNKQIALSPKTNFSTPGNYSNGNKESPGLTWTVISGY
ncbi:hypothetical protein GSH19_05465 [Lactobacillus sp. S2-2]|uniref:pectate lyase-like adhesive domain-containing protein n=1 Tax=Lactobacillus sp. S2-2 TaxID=2692917 RepID=UPI001F3EFD1C|nr:pectate lyase-like adhesive domain-containing protein [Lactobacillus sp. S2-2]MCF6515601.1 hypothetical protein [Lactobacillus sp. S2-2]